jgi:hypothetical protein
LGVRIPISGLIGSNLQLPILALQIGETRVCGTPVPKASVDEYSYMPTRKHKVGFSPKFRDWSTVHEVAQASPVEFAPQSQFWQCVPTGLPAHSLVDVG